ncbi:MAG TPA: hypothetical protein VIB39_04100 [Candidatus Angelobacter sp.]|jgi:hypothetical protein
MFVKFYRPFEPGSFEGYVLDVGPQFFLLAVVNDEFWFNGFACLRIADVRRLQAPAKYAAFAEAVLNKRGEWLAEKPKIDLSNISNLLRTANDAFPLITIHRERIDADVCHIGRVATINNSTVFLLEIGPDAVWDRELCSYRLREITRVDFGGGYEEALHLVGGLPDSGS